MVGDGMKRLPTQSGYKPQNKIIMKKSRIKLLLMLIFFIGLPLFATESKIDTLEIQNKNLSVKISLKGAEIISIFNKKEKFEHIWQGEKESWNQHAPILFPIVGKLKEGSYQFDGKNYKMNNHGFASYSLFTLINKTDSEVILQLESSPETLKMYPYKFRLLVKYVLSGKKLTVTNTVINLDKNEMFFSIGAHPGFNIPFSGNEKFNDYYLEFDKKETVNRLPLTKKKGLLSQQKISDYLNKTKKIQLHHQMFKDRAIILEGLESKTVSIKSDHSKFEVKVGIKDFPLLGVWTSSKKDAPFICIEPWYGVSDGINSTGNFKNKKAIKSIDPGKRFLMVYYIEIENLN